MFENIADRLTDVSLFDSGATDDDTNFHSIARAGTKETRMRREASNRWTTHRSSRLQPAITRRQ
jgi:hypothetical protein